VGGGLEARKPMSLKSGGLKLSSLIEVYAYGAHLTQKFKTFRFPSHGYLNGCDAFSHQISCKYSTQFICDENTGQQG